MLERKLTVLALMIAVLLIASAWSVARWLDDSGAISLARMIRREFLTGTAITVIAALLILLPSGRRPARDQWPFE